MLVGGVGKEEFLFVVGGSVNCFNYYGFLKKIEMYLLYDLVVLLVYILKFDIGF